MFSYYVPKETKRRVIRLIKSYYTLVSRKTAVETELLTDYGRGTTYRYDRTPTSPTNNISRKTEEIVFAEGHLELLREQQELDETITAINNGLLRAAKTNRSSGQAGRVYDSLKEHLLEGKSRTSLEIDPATLSKYRKRAIYYVAMELGLLDRENL